MERLTERHDHGIKMAAGHNFYIDPDDYDLVQEILSRLAAYEDTGLEPGEIYENRLIIATQKDPQKLRRLAELVNADSEGRLVVLPCKVGDTAWVKDRAGVPREMRLEPADIRFVCTDEDNLCMATCHRRPDGFCVYRLRNDGTDIGKTVFFTHEEAERALEGGNGGG